MAVAERYLDEFLPESEASRRFVGSVYERFDASLRGFLMNKLRNEADAEDFAQEVYVRFARMRDHREIRSERAFLFTTATNLLRDRSRRLVTQLDKASVPVDNVSLECNADDPARRVQHAEQLERFEAALEELSDNCRQAFWSSRVDGLSYAEIAEQLGVSVSMVEKHISAALQHIRDLM